MEKESNEPTAVQADEITEENQNDLPTKLDQSKNYDPSREVRQDLLSDLQRLVEKMASKEGKLNRKDLTRTLTSAVRLSYIQDRLISHLLETVFNVMMNTTQEGMRSHNTVTYVGAIAELLIEKDLLTADGIAERHEQKFYDSSPDHIKKQIDEARQKREADKLGEQTDPEASTPDAEVLPETPELV